MTRTDRRSGRLRMNAGRHAATRTFGFSMRLSWRRHPSTCCRLKLRKLMYITGRTAMKSRVASAAPRPSSKNWKISWNMRLATTSSPNRPPVVT